MKTQKKYIGIRLDVETRDRFKKLAVLQSKTMIQYLADLSKSLWEAIDITPQK